MKDREQPLLSRVDMQFREKFMSPIARLRQVAMCIWRGEDFRLDIKGEIFWRLWVPATGEILGTGQLKNIVTYDASILIARLIKPMASPMAHTCEPAFGAYALAVGTGYTSWDLQAPPPATKSQRSLWNELGRKEFQSSNYVDLSGGVSSVRTNVIDLTTTFLESEAVGPITEMGILGGDIDINMAVRNPVLPPNGPYDPTVDVSGKDTLLNYVTFPVINKPSDGRLNWTWRLTF